MFYRNSIPGDIQYQFSTFNNLYEFTAHTNTNSKDHLVVENLVLNTELKISYLLIHITYQTQNWYMNSINKHLSLKIIPHKTNLQP